MLTPVRSSRRQRERWRPEPEYSHNMKKQKGQQRERKEEKEKKKKITIIVFHQNIFTVFFYSEVRKKCKEFMPLLPTERLEVCKLCPSFLLWRGVLRGCWIPYTWSNIHGNTGGGGLWVHGLKHSCPSRPCTHKTTHWDSAEFSESSAILKAFQSDLDHSNEIPETNKKRVHPMALLQCLQEAVSQVTDN